MALTIRVLKRFHRAVQDYAADRVRVVATAALRDSRNSRAFLDWVRSATGWKAEIITGLEEGRLIHLGILSNARIANKRALLIDLGGGSCELTISVSGHIEDMVSLPIGAVRLTQTFLHHDPPKKNELEQMRGFVQREISRIQKRIREANVQTAIATSGTPAAFSGLYEAKVGGYDESKPHTVPHRRGLENSRRNLSKRNLDERRALPGIGPRRAEIIIAGAMVFAELMDMCALRSFRYLPLGLRDGLLAQMLADYGDSSAMKERVESERHDALLAAAKHYRADLAFAQRIRDSHHATVSPAAIRASLAAAVCRLAGSRSHAARGRRVHQSLRTPPPHPLHHCPVGAFRIHAGAAPHHRRHRALRGQFPARSRRSRSCTWFPVPTRCRCPRRSRCCGWRARSIRDAAARWGVARPHPSGRPGAPGPQAGNCGRR